jgi:hypothetical protein
MAAKNGLLPETLVSIPPGNMEAFRQGKDLKGS